MNSEYTCPLCCDEKFETRESLRYHLLSMSVNLYCPKCNVLCEKGLGQLVDHLAVECPDPNTTKIEETTPKKDPEIKIKIAPDDDEDDDVENQEIEMLNDIEENSFVTLEDGSEIMVTTIDAEHAEEETNQVEMEAEETLEGAEEVYSCSSCGVNFTSIMEHIEQFHDGQEVVVEVTDNNDEEGAAGAEIDEDSTQKEVSQHHYFDEDNIDTTDSDEADTETNCPQILNTLRQEECVDKDGRVYTRKVVQIEKFWNEKSAPTKENPLTEFYIINEDQTIKKVNKSDLPAEEDSETGKIIKFYSCQRCQTQFSKLRQFHNHVCDDHKTTFHCNKCDATFSNSKSLCAHMKTHKEPKIDMHQGQLSIAPFLCTKCDTVFPTNKSLRLHQRMHDPIKVKEIEAPVDYGITGPMDCDPNKPREMFICPVCNKTYDKGYELIHMATHSGDVDYHCDTCNRKFFTHENLEMHMRVHNGGKPFSCTYCKNSFDTNEALTEHMDAHTKDRPYSCGYCGRKFGRPHEKVKHERIHTGEKPHECEICGKTFRVSYCLTLHMRTHTGARPYVCKHCGKRFKAHSVYNHHLLTHSDQRNYKCPYCPKAFKTGVQLAGHKNSHTKPFSCTECNRPFASLYAVRSHMQSHKRENNLKFSCYICGASYARNFALRDHIKDVHNSTQVLIASENGEVVMAEKQIKIEELENLKAAESIMPDEEDETEMALHQLQTGGTDEDL